MIVSIDGSTRAGYAAYEDDTAIRTINIDAVV